METVNYSKRLPEDNKGVFATLNALTVDSVNVLRLTTSEGQFNFTIDSGRSYLLIDLDTGQEASLPASEVFDRLVLNSGDEKLIGWYKIYVFSLARALREVREIFTELAEDTSFMLSPQRGDYQISLEFSSPENAETSGGESGMEYTITGKEEYAKSDKTVPTNYLFGITISSKGLEVYGEPDVVRNYFEKTVNSFADSQDPQTRLFVEHIMVWYRNFIQRRLGTPNQA